MADKMPGKVVKLGRVSGVYGIKGWVKIHSYTRPMENILNYSSWMLERQGQWSSARLEQGRPHGKGLIAKFFGCDDRDVAQTFVGLEIGMNESELPSLEDGDYYWHQLEGLSVTNCEGELLGRVDRMMSTGANDVMVVKPIDGSLDDQERLIPYVVEQYVLEVDLANKNIKVDWGRDF